MERLAKSRFASSASAVRSSAPIEALLALDGDEVGDGVLVFPTPRNEGGLGDFELSGKAGERPALDAEVNETLNGFVVVHTVLLQPEIEARGTA